MNKIPLTFWPRLHASYHPAWPSSFCQGGCRHQPASQQRASALQFLQPCPLADVKGSGSLKRITVALKSNNCQCVLCFCIRNVLKQLRCHLGLFPGRVTFLKIVLRNVLLKYGFYSLERPFISSLSKTRLRCIQQFLIRGQPSKMMLHVVSPNLLSPFCSWCGIITCTWALEGHCSRTSFFCLSPEAMQTKWFIDPVPRLLLPSNAERVTLWCYKTEKIKVLVPGIYQMLKDIVLGFVSLLVCPVLCDTRGKTCHSEVKFH